MADNEEKKGGFWSSIPGALTAIAGVITAVAALVAALNAAGVIGGKTTASATASPPNIADDGPPVFNSKQQPSKFK